MVSNGTFAQSSDFQSDLKIKIDSIIPYQIGYFPDSTTDVMPSHIWDTTQHRGMPPSFSSFPPNPMTAVSLDGRRISMDELNAYQVKDIANIQVFPKDDARAVALFGSRAANGLILIQTKKAGFFKKGKRH
jgi:TonB-dependent SusC/RagA subfamily outer membrane receptor